MNLLRRADLKLGDAEPRALQTMHDPLDIKSGDDELSSIAGLPACYPGIIRRSAATRQRHQHMTGDHHGQGAGRATLLVRAVDAIVGTHTMTQPEIIAEDEIQQPEEHERLACPTHGTISPISTTITRQQSRPEAPHCTGNDLAH